MSTHIACSFWVHRPEQFPTAPDYLALLRLVDQSAKRFGFDHLVLTDYETAPRIREAGLSCFAMDLPRSLMKATTEAHACWIESPMSQGLHTVCIGADCLIRRDFRADLPASDLSVAFMRDHKRWKINNGLVAIPPSSREKIAPLLRSIADDTSEEMFDDMLAFERALSPMPPDFGCYDRRGLAVEFLPLPIWNRYMAVTKQTPKPLEDAAEGANVLHFMGGHDNGKALMFDWAKAYGFD
jgi:hypothetical protein